MNPRIRTDVLLLVAFCGFLFFYGLGSFGLIGADEPRYAQVAREMLQRHDWITPTLHGAPWLEKPVLYYWQAMLVTRVWRAFLPADAVPDPLSGSADQTARLPSAIDAALMIALVYLFLRRFRPGTQIDGALITASCAATIGFARAAATDMPLAAMFAIAMLGWYAWYESKRRMYSAVFYLFLALATLAKGPVALVLAAAILLIFAAVNREWPILLRTLWTPGIVLFLAVTLPWYITVQVNNPQFFRVFILEHNLARFSQDLYHHRQPFWFFVPVLLLATMPWTLWLVLAIVDSAKSCFRSLQSGQEPRFAVFLLIWLAVPVVFFSASQSKLPGYILPSIPAGALLVTWYLAAKRGVGTRMPWPLATIHAILCGGLVFAALMSANIVVNRHLSRSAGVYIAGGIAAVVALGLAVALRSANGFRFVRFATLIPVVLGVAAILKLATPSLDAKLSARPIAQTIRSFAKEDVPVAMNGATREQEFGLEFYLNRKVARYESGQVPLENHILVVPSGTQAEPHPFLAGRKVSYLTTIPAQNVELYWIGAATGPSPTPPPH